MVATEELSVQVGVAPACEAMGVSRATFYRRRAGCVEASAERAARTPAGRNGDGAK